MKGQLPQPRPAALLKSAGRHVPALILLAGFAIRLVFLFQAKGHLLFERPLLDAEFYHRWAVEIAGGDWAGAKRGVFMMSPGYSYFVAVIYSLFGVRTTAVVFAQFLVGLGCGWMVYLLGKRHLSREAGLVGAALYLLYAPEIFFESVLLKASLINAVSMGALLAASAAHPAGWLLSGLLTGCSAHLRPTALLLGPVLALWLWRRAPRRWTAVLCFVGGTIAALLPVAARNSLVGGEWVWTTSHGGMNFYTGNSPGTRGPYTSPPFARTDAAYEQDDFLAEARRRAGRELTPAESSRYWYLETWRLIRRDPRRELRLLLNKALIFTNAYEPSINIDYYLFRKTLGSVLAWPLLSFALLLPLAVVGMARAAPNLLLLGYLGVIFVTNVGFFVTSEYRFPIVPVLCLYGGWGLCRIADDIRTRALARLTASAAALLLLSGLAVSDIYGRLLGMPNYGRITSARSAYNLGWVCQEAGRTDEAIAAYLEAARLDPAFAEPHNNLGVVLAGRGRLAEAVSHFEQALALRPDLPEAHGDLGILLARLGRHQEAEAHFREARRLETLRGGR